MLEIKPIFNALRRSKVGAVLLLIQIAITTAIVSNAAFIINDRITYLNQDTGYPEDSIFSFGVMTFGKDRDISQQFEEDEAMLRNMPGVIDAALFSSVPLSGSGSSTSMRLQPEPQKSRTIPTAYLFADEHALNTLDLTLAEGRNFDINEVLVTQDRSKLTEVAIVSRAFLNDAFPEGDGLGKIVYMGDLPFKIIGVVEQMKGPWLKSDAPDNVIITPFIQAQSYQKIVVRTAPEDRADIMKQMEDKMLAAYDKRVVVNVIGLDENKAQYNASDTLMMRMLMVLIVVLVAVTALGIFGLTLFNISKRTRQIGTRRALGARKSAIIRYFLIENTMVCLAGLLVGSGLAVWLGHELISRFSVPPLRHTYVMITAAVVLVMSLLAVIFPARRAARISPSVATRSI